MNLRFARRAAVLLVLLLLTTACTFQVTERTFIRPSPDVAGTDSTIALPEIAGLTQQPFELAVDDAVLRGVVIRQPGAQRWVLYFGGNLFRISKGGAIVAGELLPFGVNLVMVDHRGSGRSSGEPNVARLESDALRVHDAVRAQFGLAPEQLVVHGFSLGSLMAGHVAAHRPLVGLVLEGSGSTVTEWVRRGIPWYGKPFVRTEIEPGLAEKGNLGNVQRSRAPLLLLVGRKDKQAPWKMSRTLFEASATPASSKRLVVIAKAQHGDVLNFAEARSAYAEWLAALPAAGAAAAASAR